MSTFLTKLSCVALATGLALASSTALASGSKSYRVTITNLTNSINFTPILVASHRKGLDPIFELGSPASPGMTDIAEAGDVSTLSAALWADSDVVDVKDSGGLLGPGESVTVEVSANHGARHISVASMMLPTNDGFIGLNGVKAKKKGTVFYLSPGYDAGTEPNDEMCVNIPGPTCGGTGPSPWNDPDDEGYVHIHRGMQGIGDLPDGAAKDPKQASKDWRNPVAKITITRVRNKDDDDDD